MTENYIQLPTDIANTGALVRTNQRLVNGSSVEEHFMILQDYASDNQAKVDSDGHVFVAGSITSMPKVTIGSVYATVDSMYIQSGDNIAITSLPSQMGSVGVTALPPTLGSVYIKSGIVGVSGDYFQDMLGSVRISAPPLGVSGTIFDDGNLTGSMSLQGIGSVVIKSAPLIGVSGAIFDSGDITGSVVVSSASLIGVSGLIFTDGNLTGSMAMQGIGSMVIASSSKLGVSGIVEINQVLPNDTTQNNPAWKFIYMVSGTVNGVAGSAIGSIWQTIGTGSYVQVLTWSNDMITNVGSWSI